MSEKILGKLMSVTVDGTEVDIQDHNYNEQFNVVEVTDTGTTGDAKETIVTRATRELKISGVVKSAGVAVKAKDMGLTWDQEQDPYRLTDVNFDESYDEIDVTDSGTTGDGMESLAGFAERKLSFDLWIKDTEASIPRGVAKATTLTLAAGITIGGNFRPESMSNQGAVKDAQKQTIAGTFQGAITESPNPIGGVPMAVSKAVVLKYKTGTTNKQLSGNAIFFSRSISGNINGEYKISWGMKFNGAVPETQYST